MSKSKSKSLIGIFENVQKDNDIDQKDANLSKRIWLIRVKFSIFTFRHFTLNQVSNLMFPSTSVSFQLITSTLKTQKTIKEIREVILITQ